MLVFLMIQPPWFHRAVARLRRANRVVLFVGVGSCAAAVHWVVVVWLVAFHQWPPLLANLMGWLVALGVSFFGHYSLTFRDHNASLSVAAIRFTLVSAFGFALNEAAYALLLRGSGQWYAIKLAAVLLGVAVLTYGLSRHWAFLRSPAD